MGGVRPKLWFWWLGMVTLHLSFSIKFGQLWKARKRMKIKGCPEKLTRSKLCWPLRLSFCAILILSDWHDFGLPFHW